jgi:adenylate cyclase
MRFRIGVHVGEIIEKADGTIYGDGVNIAARLEGLAEPGGITVSDSVRSAARGKVAAAFEDQGEQAVKNIAEPVRAFKVNPEGGAPTPPASAVRETAPTLPDKPSIAVLPFTNMSGDAEQEYFADGMTEDLITDLSKVSGLFVVARNSTFAYKGKQVDVRAVARELGVRYVLEGSVRKAGDRVRINVQLIDASDGGHLWAERHDGAIANVFELQDDVGAKVVSALSVKLKRSEEDRFNHVHTHNLDAYELFVRAKGTPYPPVPQRIEMAREMFERVIEMDPTFAGGHAGVSWMLGLNALFAYSDATPQLDRAVALARKAIEIDKTFGISYLALGVARIQQDAHDEAVAALRDAIARQPNDGDAHCYLGLILGFSGVPDEGIASIEYALRLNPQFINGPYLNMLGLAQMFAGNYDAAVKCHERNMARHGPIGPPALCWLAGSYWALGRHDEARTVSARVKKEFPIHRLTTWNLLPTIRPATTRERVYALMRDAGIPE